MIIKKLLNYIIWGIPKTSSTKVGCCDDTVSKILKAHNIPIRGGSTKNRLV